jgi:hypothetical protein
MSQGELHSLALSLFLPRTFLAENPFRFLVSDDPVQSMDPAKADGRARVLALLAEHRQVMIRPATTVPSACPPRLPAVIPPPPPPASTCGELLAGTDRLLGTATASTTGVWPRAVALLRHALEEALRRYWQARKPQLAHCPPHAQALCMESHAAPDTARHWSATWAGLSRACHYHGYELAPTQVELCGWRDDVERVIRALAPCTH